MLDGIFGYYFALNGILDQVNDHLCRPGLMDQISFQKSFKVQKTQLSLSSYFSLFSGSITDLFNASSLSFEPGK